MLFYFSITIHKLALLPCFSSVLCHFKLLSNFRTTLSTFFSIDKAAYSNPFWQIAVLVSIDATSILQFHFLSTIPVVYTALRVKTEQNKKHKKTPTHTAKKPTKQTPPKKPQYKTWMSCLPTKQINCFLSVCKSHSTFGFQSMIWVYYNTVC